MGWTLICGFVLGFLVTWIHPPSQASSVIDAITHRAQESADFDKAYPPAPNVTVYYYNLYILTYWNPLRAKLTLRDVHVGANIGVCTYVEWQPPSGWAYIPTLPSTQN